MNQVRKALARLAAKALPRTKVSQATAPARELKKLDSEQLRQVVGGSGDGSPKGNW